MKYSIRAPVKALAEPFLPFSRALMSDPHPIANGNNHPVEFRHGTHALIKRSNSPDIILLHRLVIKNLAVGKCIIDHQ